MMNLKLLLHQALFLLPPSMYSSKLTSLLGEHHFINIWREHNLMNRGFIYYSDPYNKFCRIDHIFTTQKHLPSFFSKL